MYFFDENTYSCYGLEDNFGVGYHKFEGDWVCSEEHYGWVFELWDDYQLEGIVDATKHGNLTLSGKKFWTAMTVNSHGQLVNGYGYPLLGAESESNFTLIDLPDVASSGENLTDSCVTASFDDARGVFVAELADCWEETYPLVCVTVPDDPLLCSGGAGDGTVKRRRRRRKKRQAEYVSEKLENMLNPDKKSESAQDSAKARRSYHESFNSVNMTESYEHFFELLWYSQLPCFDVRGVTSERNDQNSLLKKCFWKGMDIACAAIFTQFPTDRGMCCTFNMKRAEEIFKESRYTNMVTKMQQRDKKMAFGNPVLPEWYRSKEEPKSHQGVKKGLTVMLDAHTDIIAPSSISEDFQGFIAMVSNSDSYPVTSLKNIRLKAGHDNMVAMTAVDVTADEALKDEENATRNCYFSDEFPLVVHREYTQANCILECQVRYALDQMGPDLACIPWYLPTDAEEGDGEFSYPLCDPWSAKEFRSKVEEVTTECDYCLPDCAGTIYEQSVSAVPFRRCDNKNLGISRLCNLDDPDPANPPLYAEQIMQEYQYDLPYYLEGRFESNLRKYSQNYEDEVFIYSNKIEGYDAYSRDIGSVSFYFESPVVFQYRRQPRMTTVDFMSQVGGLMGLCIGFSFCSGVEVAYWFLVRIPLGMVGCGKKANKKV